MNTALQCEMRRKSIHLMMGVFCMTLPWIFSSPWQVDLLAAISVSILLLIRWFTPRFGKILHEVKRLSFGELLFPVAITILFRLSADDLEIYLPSVAILTFADAAGALFGKRYGKHLYYTNAGQKSLEGSLAVFLVSTFITFTLGPSGDLPNTLLIALIVGLIATMAEGILGAGIDNIVLPLTIYGLLSFLNELNLIELLSRIGIIFTLSTILFAVRRITTLNGGGLLSVTVFGYLCYALGGSLYLIAPLTFFAIHLVTTWNFPKLKELAHSANTVAAITLPGIIWLSLARSSTYSPSTCLLGFSLTFVAQISLIHTATHHYLNKPSGTLACLVKALLVSLSSWHPIALAPPIAVRWLGPLNRVEQSLLSFIFSLMALIPIIK